MSLSIIPTCVALRQNISILRVNSKYILHIYDKRNVHAEMCMICSLVQKPGTYCGVLNIFYACSKFLPQNTIYVIAPFLQKAYHFI